MFEYGPYGREAHRYIHTTLLNLDLRKKTVPQWVAKSSLPLTSHAQANVAVHVNDYPADRGLHFRSPQYGLNPVRNSAFGTSGIPVT